MSIEKVKQAKVITNRSLSVVVCVLFGILVAAQLRSLPTRISDPTTPYFSLKQTRDDLYSEQNQLKDEIKQLHTEIQKAQDERDSVSLGGKELSQLQTKKAEAGVTMLEGPGISITLDDSENGPTTEDSIVHAADLRDVLNLLWGAGAEGISINNQRVVINTAVDCIVNTILVNNVRISTPFTIEAIGSKDMLYSQITNQNMLSNLWSRKDKNGLIFDVNKKDQIRLPIFDGTFDVKTEVVK